jgi:DNA-binding response OmpR family regulator
MRSYQVSNIRMRVLIIEDYAPIRQAICEGLSEAGFELEVASDGAEGLSLALATPFDVIILDLMLPKIDGFTILQRLRDQNVKAFIMILTAKGNVDERIRGLDLGADDYLTKPFVFAELLSRIRAMIRRKYGAPNPIIRIADVEIDTIRRIVRRNGHLIELTAKEYALLEYLALRSGEVVTRDDVWDHVYDFRGEAQSNVIDVYIGYLRRKLAQPGCPKLIHTRRGQGYVLEESG